MARKRKQDLLASLSPEKRARAEAALASTRTPEARAEEERMRPLRGPAEHPGPCPARGGRSGSDHSPASGPCAASCVRPGQASPRGGRPDPGRRVPQIGPGGAEAVSTGVGEERRLYV